MLEQNIAEIAVELLPSAVKRVVPRSWAEYCRDRVQTLRTQWKVVQARLPEPVVVVGKMVLAFVLLPLLFLTACCAPGVCKMLVGILDVEAKRAQF